MYLLSNEVFTPPKTNHLGDNNLANHSVFAKPGVFSLPQLVLFSWQCPLLDCCLSGDWCTVTVQGERVWCDDGQKEALWLAGPDFSQIRPHGQWLLCVSNLLMTSLKFLQFRCSDLRRSSDWTVRLSFFVESPWQSWTFWTRCLRLKLV